jgi:hypothetical protein
VYKTTALGHPRNQFASGSREMKFIVVVLALCALALADEVEDAKKKHHDQINECIKETGTSEEVAEKLKDGDFSVRDEKAQVSVVCVCVREFRSHAESSNELICIRL